MKKTTPQLKCDRPKGTAHRGWAGCDNCWVAFCGHSRLTKPNPHWRKLHGICRYEHCIETQHAGMENTPKSCPIFGHDCPGGARSAAACRKQLKDEVQKRKPGRDIDAKKLRERIAKSTKGKRL